MKRYPRQLSSGDNNVVIALNETEVAKIYESDTRSDIGSEAEKMKFANGVNNLVVRFIRIDFDEDKQWERLVMERLFAMDYRSIEFEKRELIFSVFEDELQGLHRAGFAHRDLARPSNMPGERYDTYPYRTSPDRRRYFSAPAAGRRRVVRAIRRTGNGRNGPVQGFFP